MRSAYEQLSEATRGHNPTVDFKVSDLVRLLDNSTLPSDVKQEAIDTYITRLKSTTTDSSYVGFLRAAARRLYDAVKMLEGVEMPFGTSKELAEAADHVWTTLGEESNLVSPRHGMDGREKRR